MGVFDDIKDSITGSSSESSGNNDFEDDTGFDGSDFDNSFQNNSPPAQDSTGGNPPGSGNPPAQDSQPGYSKDVDQPNQQGINDPEPGNQDLNQNQGDINPDRGLDNNQGGGRNTGRRRDAGRRTERNQNPSPADSPNPQTGRPQEGDAKPQLSQNTRKELENAGLRDDTGQSVADRKDDIEELKSQNRQIIEILKRINDNLQGQTGGQNTGRHGGRR